MRHNYGNLRTDVESECDNCNVSFVVHVVDSQNDVKDEDLVRDDNSNTLWVGNLYDPRWFITETGIYLRS